MPLVARMAPPGTLEHEPSDALLVVDAFEAALPEPLRLLARLAAGLAAGPRDPAPPPEHRVKRFARRVLRKGV
jgi:hypothetical protein